MSIELLPASPSDAPLLARMNRQLIIDEHSRNRMSEDELETRMRDWLERDMRAVLIRYRHEVIGYLLYRRMNVENEYGPNEQVVYVRQFYIERSYRRRGIGQMAFEQITNEYFPSHVTLTLDVLESNPEAKAFWHKLGFETYCTTMRRDSSA